MEDPHVTQSKTDRWAHRRGEPRTFAALWIGFLFLSALVSIGAAGSLGMVSTDVYRTSARLLLILVGIGVGVLWPMLRLSQEMPEQPGRAFLNDIIVVAAPLQAVAWPQALPWMASWPIPGIACLAANLTAWVVFIGGSLALISRGIQVGQPRWAWTLAFVALSLAGPGMHVILEGDETDVPRAAHWLLTSPVSAPWEIVRDRSWSGSSILPGVPHWVATVMVGVLGLILWVRAATTE